MELLKESAQSCRHRVRDLLTQIPKPPRPPRITHVFHAFNHLAARQHFQLHGAHQAHAYLGVNVATRACGRCQLFFQGSDMRVNTPGVRTPETTFVALNRREKEGRSD